MINLGLKFFIITATSLTITHFLPFLIQRISNPVEVTNFNTSFRLFALAFNVFGIIVLPYWSSFTDAYTQKDFTWMQQAVSKLRKCVLYVLLFEGLILLLSPILYYVWINYWMKDTSNMLHIPFFMSLSVCIYVSTTCWMNACIYPINGIGKIRLQIYSSIGEVLLIVPLALWLGHLWGAPGVILAASLVYLPRMIWAPIQLNRLVSGKSTGIWNQ